MTRKLLVRVLATFIVCLTVLDAPVVVATDRAPLLMLGKSTLFQRVLTRPSAQLLAGPGGQVIDALPPLSIFYVYGRQLTETGEEFIEVGSDSIGNVNGWIASDKTIEWKQSLVLTFANPAGRERVLFFDGESALSSLLQGENVEESISILRDRIDNNDDVSDAGVIAQEPEEFIDIRKQFYLLPILQAHETMLDSGFRSNIVEIASVTTSEDAAKPIESERTNLSLSNFSAALVFVIDASSSMGPYIDVARQVITGVFDRVGKAGLHDRMRFGLIGYRDDPLAVPGIEYLTRMFVDPNNTSDGESFIDQASSLAPSSVSTRTYEEDGFAGIVQAIDEIDWSSFGGRYVVFVTDASSREAGDPLASTGLNADQVRERLLEESIALYTVHLKTPEGESDHGRAEMQYQVLSNYPNVGSLYYPVEAGSLDQFRANIDTLAEAIVSQVDAASRGEFAAGTRVITQDRAQALDPTADLREKTAALGYAMQLSYIGRERATEAPPLLRAWAMDRDLSDPTKQALQVRILLTKNQLSDLQMSLKEIVRIGIETETSRDMFFDQLRSATATLSRDPSKIGSSGTGNLGELGLLGEYLDDLPYRSRILSLSNDMWNRWSIGEQVAFIDDLEAKIRLYQSFHDNVDSWVSLHDNASPGDAVYPVPLSALP